MNIEIEPIKVHNVSNTNGIYPVAYCYPHDVRELEAKYKEAIEALKSLELRLKRQTTNGVPVKYCMAVMMARSKARGIIEKATGKSWKELTI